MDITITDTEKKAYEFLQLYHPEQLLLIPGMMQELPVAVICWADGNMIRPLAIALDDNMIANIELQGIGRFTQD